MAGKQIFRDGLQVSSHLLRPIDWIAALLIAGAFLALALVYARQTPIGVPPDEWAHITYLQEASTEGRFIPDYASSRILPARVTPNYLSHPPLYYTLLGKLGSALGWEVVEDFRKYRGVSALFVAIGLALWVLIARSLGLTLILTVPIIMSVGAVPLFPILAGSVNNDNLAYLAAALAVFGIVRTGRPSCASWYVGAAGLAMALLTKATVGTFLVLVFLLWILQTLMSPSRAVLFNKHFVIAATLVVAVVAPYYVHTLLSYGSFFPVAGGLYAHNGLPRDALSFAEFVLEFFSHIFSYLPMVMTHAVTEPLGETTEGLLIGMVPIPLLAWMTSFLWRSRGDGDRLVDAMFMAALITLTIHILIVWRAYNLYGFITGTQPRYYFYLLPGLSIAGFLRYKDNPVVRALGILFSMMALYMIMIVPRATLVAETRRHTPVPPPALLQFSGVAVPVQQLKSVGLLSTNAGHVDELVLAEGILSVKGWAVDTYSPGPATRIDVYYNGRRVGSTTPSLFRPDVAKALDDGRVKNSGFHLRISYVPPEVSRCDFQFAAVQSQGLPVALRTFDCR